MYNFVEDSSPVDNLPFLETEKQCISQQLHYRSNGDCEWDIQRSEDHNHGKEG